MEPLSNSNDVYNHLVENSKADWVSNLLAFSIVEEQRIEWMKHQKNSSGSLPTEEEIRKWYTQQPEGVLIKAKAEAANALDNFYREALDTALDRERDEIRNSLVITQINKLGNFWTRFWQNILITVISFFCIYNTFDNLYSWFVVTI